VLRVVVSTAERGSPLAPDIIVPGWCSIEEMLESGDAMETESCAKVDHSSRVFVVDVSSSPLGTGG
jgi:hypothetical protein